MPETTQPNVEEIRYVLYSPKDGRILGTYAHYDADAGACVRCQPEEVIEASLSASPELESGSFEVLEVNVSGSDQLEDLRVDPKEKKLVARKPARARPGA